MMRGDYLSAKIRLTARLVLGVWFLCASASICSLAAQQASPEVPPDATPQIQQLSPSQALPGAHATVVIQGSNFSGGAYASSASAAIHIDSSKRVSATQLEVQLTVSDSAQPGTVSLLVSNPASGSAESAFSIVATETAPVPAAAPQNPEPPKTEAPPAPPTQAATPQTPAAPPAAPPAPPAPEANPAPPAAPATPPAPQAPAAAAAPEVTSVNPPRVAQGSDVDLRVNGKNFAQGAKVSFSNQGIRVTGVTSPSSTQLIVSIRVTGDAAPGQTSMFIINPDENEAEGAFEVTKKGATTPSTPPAPGAPATPPEAAFTQRYDAFHLGNPTEIFHVHGKVKGSLVISGGTVKYQEDGQTLFNFSASEIAEAKTAGIGGFNIKLNSGKTIHFAAASLKGSDARAIVDAIHKVMPNPPAE